MSYFDVVRGPTAMRARTSGILCAIATLAIEVSAQDITGTILIKKKLTRPSVTSSVSVYQRGTTIKTAKDSQGDPIAYERSRVVVYLEGPESLGADSAIPPAVQIQQIDRRFAPDLVIAPVGSTISFPNMDPIFHNIYSLSKPKSFDLGSYDKGETRKVTFPKPGIVEIYCHLHPNMAATVFVTPNHWYARPDASGQYRIADVPPGQYTLVAWHKSAGFFRKSIVVENGRSASADFFIPIEVESKQNAEAKRDLGQGAGSR
jgi:plastocyanin